MDAWEAPGSAAERELPLLFRQGSLPAALSLAAARRARCGATARAGGGGGSGGGGGAACEAVTVAEWALLSRCPALLLSEDSPLSALVAASAPPSAQVWLGCRGSWRRPPDAPQTAERRAAAELAAVRALAEQPAASLRRYVVDEASGLIFCWMPKVACTSFKVWLRRLAGVADPLDLKTLHASKGSGLTTLADFPPLERVRLLTSLRRAVFVRDPWTRLLSAYLNKFVEEPEARRRGWLKELLRPLRDGGAARGGGARGAAARAAHGALVAEAEASPEAQPSFATFLAVLEASAAARPALMNEHWAPQADLCSLQTLRYDFVGEMRSLAADVQALGSLLGLEVLLPQGSDYGWQGNRNASRQLAHHYTSRALVARVARVYARDAALPLHGVHYHASGVFGASMPKKAGGGEGVG